MKTISEVIRELDSLGFTDITDIRYNMRLSDNRFVYYFIDGTKTSVAFYLIKGGYADGGMEFKFYDCDGFYFYNNHCSWEKIHDITDISTLLLLYGNFLENK